MQDTGAGGSAPGEALGQTVRNELTSMGKDEMNPAPPMSENQKSELRQRRATTCIVNPRKETKRVCRYTRQRYLRLNFEVYIQLLYSLAKALSVSVSSEHGIHYCNWLASYFNIYSLFLCSSDMFRWYS